MKHKKERMYMAYMIQQRPQQISTENLAYQKRKSVADNAVGCKAESISEPCPSLLRLLTTLSDVKHPLFSSLFSYYVQRIQQNQRWNLFQTSRP